MLVLASTQEQIFDRISLTGIFSGHLDVSRRISRTLVADNAQCHGFIGVSFRCELHRSIGCSALHGLAQLVSITVCQQGGGYLLPVVGHADAADGQQYEEAKRDCRRHLDT